LGEHQAVDACDKGAQQQNTKGFCLDERYPPQLRNLGHAEHKIYSGDHIVSSIFDFARHRRQRRIGMVMAMQLQFRRSGRLCEQLLDGADALIGFVTVNKEPLPLDLERAAVESLVFHGEAEALGELFFIEVAQVAESRISRLFRTHVGMSG
jgi:hypothetical protein